MGRAQKLPTMNRARMRILNYEDGELKEIDIKNLSFQDRRNLLERLVKVVEENNEKFLLKLKEIFKKVGIDYPTIEVRYVLLNVEAQVYVGRRNLPSFVNSILNTVEEIEKFETDLITLHPILTECRVLKSKLELDLIQYANDVSSEAHVEVMRRIRAEMKEYQLESIFLHHIYMYGGCRHCSYTCICATGENSAVLHYGHAAAPNDRALKEGDMALFDMGSEYHFYGSDITCSFPVSGQFTNDQAAIYNAVLGAHDSVIKSMSPGVSWIVMHKLAEKIILESLQTVGIIVGDIDEMMAERLGAVFMPHGLGHLLGIDTHDPGGYTKGMERPKEAGLSSLRTIRELKEGMVITVEPGCYFIDALLNPALEDPLKSKFLKKEELDRFKDFGGIRIESDVVVTSNGSKNLTNVPRQTWEIEAVMAGAPWPLNKKPPPNDLA